MAFMASTSRRCAPGNAAARAVGPLPSLGLDWRINRHWSYTLMYAHFFAGDFLKQAPPGESVNYVNSFLTFRF